MAAVVGLMEVLDGGGVWIVKVIARSNNCTIAQLHTHINASAKTEFGIGS